mmetsp:Transcript_24456/g.61505  ORF Transcript_24456/g.61505 Transcript_24456/m.61505 type:complete len:194 (+) Transcript_24456:83-664(+)
MDLEMDIDMEVDHSTSASASTATAPPPTTSTESRQPQLLPARVAEKLGQGGLYVETPYGHGVLLSWQGDMVTVRLVCGARMTIMRSKIQFREPSFLQTPVSSSSQTRFESESQHTKHSSKRGRFEFLESCSSASDCQSVSGHDGHSSESGGECAMSDTVGASCTSTSSFAAPAPASFGERPAVRPRVMLYTME